MDIQLFIKEGNACKALKVPVYVVKNLLRDRLSQSELDRIHRLAEPVEVPENFKARSVIIDFTSRTAQCFQTGINVVDLEPTWNVAVEKMTLENY